MTTWDVRTLARALGATVLALVVVWLVTAATDEGQLSTAVRIARTMPVAPLCSAVGVVLALGTSRVRDEARALEALGRAPSVVARPAALGAALPSLVVALALASSPGLDVQAFYPRAPRGETFAWNAEHGAFESAALGVRVGESGEAERFATATPDPEPDEGVVPAGGRAAAAAATALAGCALALLASRNVLASAPGHDRRARLRRLGALALGLGCALLTLLAFQAAAARVAPASAAIVAPAVLLAIVLLGYRDRHELDPVRDDARDA